MPKPVLSDSLFNAGDVATAVLAEANLQVTNNDLGVVDRSSLWSYGTGFANSNHGIRAYSFNGFMFISINCTSTSTPSNGATVIQISDSDFYSNEKLSAPTVSYQGDLAYTLEINTSGTVNVLLPTNVSAVEYYIVANFWYRFT